MARRLDWSRAKPNRRDETTRKQHALDNEADKLISKRQAHKQEHEFGGTFFRSSSAKEGAYERCYFRSVGSVIQRDGNWYACDGQGAIVGTYPERWQAWRHADQYGMERAQELHA